MRLSGAFVISCIDGVRYFVVPTKKAGIENNPTVVPFWYVGQPASGDPCMERFEETVKIAVGLGSSDEWDDDATMKINVPCLRNVVAIEPGDVLTVAEYTAASAVATAAASGATEDAGAQPPPDPNAASLAAPLEKIRQTGRGKRQRRS